MEVQSELFGTAMEQYAGEAARFFDTMLKSSQDIADDLKYGHSRGCDDLPI